MVRTVSAMLSAQVILFASMLNVAPVYGDQTPREDVIPFAVLPALTNMLHDEERDVRIAAVWALSGLGVEGLDKLQSVLNDKNSDLRFCIISALGDRASKAEPESRQAAATCAAMVFEAFRAEKWEDLSSDEESRLAIALAHCARVEPTAKKQLLEALGDGEISRRRTAIMAIGEIAPHMPEALPLLVNLFRDKASGVFGSAMIAAGMIVSARPDLQPVLDAVVPEVLRCMESGDSDARIGALSMLAVMSDLPLAVGPVLLSAAANGSTADFNQATSILGGMGTRAIPLLEAALRHDNPEIRAAAANALALMIQRRPNTKEALHGTIKQLLDALADEDEFVRKHAASALGQVGDEAHQAVPILVRMALEEGREDPRWRFAASALGSMGGAAMEAVPLLVGELQNPDRDTRVGAVWALMKMGPHAWDARPALAQAYRDPDAEVRRIALMAIEDSMPDARLMIEKEKGIPELLSMLIGEDDELRDLAIRKLGLLGAEAVLAVEPLISHEHLEVREAVVRVLGGTGPAARATIPKLLELAGDDAPAVRKASLKALIQIAPESVEVFDCLDTALGDENPCVRKAAVCSLGILDSPFDKLIASLGEALKDEEISVRQATVKMLGNIGTRSVQVVDLLCKALSDESVVVRRDAAIMLSKGEFEVTTVVPALVYLLDDESCEVRAIGVRALGRVSELSIESLDAIINCLYDTQPCVRVETVRALGQICSRLSWYKSLKRVRKQWQ